jgi:hypothetical protein
MNDQQRLDDGDIARIIQTLSNERLQTFLRASGHDQERAIRLYIWNAQVGEVFHIAVQATEVGLRNAINAALILEFGAEWWASDRYQALLDYDRTEDLKLALRRMGNRRQPETNGQIVAGLSFGFWVGMLQPRYNPDLWSKRLRETFPNLPPDRSRKSLAKDVAEIATLRNRISHHEPLLKRDLLDDYARVMRILEWICPATARWIKPHCRVPQLTRLRP